MGLKSVKETTIIKREIVNGLHSLGGGAGRGALFVDTRCSMTGYTVLLEIFNGYRPHSEAGKGGAYLTQGDIDNLIEELKAIRGAMR